MAVAGLGSACAALGPDEAGAGQAALSFHLASRDDDGDRACALLADDTREELERSTAQPCAQAIVREDLPRAGEVLDIAAGSPSTCIPALRLTTVWLVQRGSPESKEIGRAGTESDEDQMVGEHAHDDSPAWARARGFRLTLYSRSLGLVMGLVFGLSWLAPSIAGQSELLAVASMVVLSIYLRQRGSPESKPVGAAHADTGIQG